MTTITLLAVDYTPAVLVGLFQSFIDLADAAVTARGVWLLAVQKEQAMRAKIFGLLAALRADVTQKFGPGAVDTQADFGFSPKKVVVRTAEQKALSAQKAVATRKARHTMGSVQKKDVVGVLPTAEPVTPATTTTAPAPAVIPPATGTTKS